VLIVAALVSLLFYRRAQQQNTQVYAAITRLQAGVAQQQLTERSRQDQKEMERAPRPASDPQNPQLPERGGELRAQIATSTTENTPALRHQLIEAESRL
jgi:hypothetical protein